MITYAAAVAPPTCTSKFLEGVPALGSTRRTITDSRVVGTVDIERAGNTCRAAARTGIIILACIKAELETFV